VGGTILVCLLSSRLPSLLRRRRTIAAGVPDVQSGNAGQKKKIDKSFFLYLKDLLKICVPGVLSKEAAALALHTAFLVTRTIISIIIAKLDGTIVKAIVERKQNEFWKRIAQWMLLGVPACMTNSMIKYMEIKIACLFRERLTKEAVKQYMSGNTFYSVSNLDGRLGNADQCLTEDIAKFSQHLSHLYSQISKPMLDIVLMTAQLVWLAKSTLQAGSGNPIIEASSIAICAIYFTNQLLRSVAPPLGSLVEEQSRTEGQYRATQSRVISFSEEIAFYKGAEVEKRRIMDSFQSMLKQIMKVASVRAPYQVLEGFLMKYTWSSAGLIMVALPSFYSKAASNEDDTTSGRTQNFVIARRLLLDASDAMERLMSAYKDVLELGGYASRVHQMFSVFADCAKGNFTRMQAGGVEKAVSFSGGAQLSTGNSIVLRGVPIKTPNGDTLVESMDLTVRQGDHTLITGPNGCGKSSLFRIIGGLWPPSGGSVETCLSIYYIPQKPYLCVGSLRQQVLYPHDESQQRSSTLDAQLLEIFKMVDLDEVLGRCGGWDSVKEWQDVLSGGEKQKLAMARLFFHKPKYAILDECTSQVSLLSEGKMYQHAKDIGITLLTVTHRPSLQEYHSNVIKFGGDGSYHIGRVGDPAFAVGTPVVPKQLTPVAVDAAVGTPAANSIC